MDQRFDKCLDSLIGLQYGSYIVLRALRATVATVPTVHIRYPQEKLQEGANSQGKFKKASRSSSKPADK